MTYYEDVNIWSLDGEPRGELPIKALCHLDILTLFWCIWANPQTKMHKIVKYLLMIIDSSFLTWTAHL